MRRYTAQDDFEALHALLSITFAFMEGRIDPPSSLSRVSVDDLKDLSEKAEIWVIEEENRPIACMILTPKAGTLYIGKMAVARGFRGTGLARELINCARKRARELGYSSLTIQTRVELFENHAVFAALGFRKTGVTAHPGFDHPTSVTMSRPV